MSNPYAHTHMPDVACSVQCPEYKMQPLPSPTPEAAVQNDLQDPQSVSLTNPEGATVSPKVYPEGVVMDLLERAFMEGCWIGGNGRAKTQRVEPYFHRWIARLKERGEL